MLVAWPEIPWDQIAVPVAKETLWLYFRDRADGGYRTRCGDIVRLDGDIRRHWVSIRVSCQRLRGMHFGSHP
jgi:hypothetical protein